MALNDSLCNKKFRTFLRAFKNTILKNLMNCVCNVFRICFKSDCSVVIQPKILVLIAKHSVIYAYKRNVIIYYIAMKILLTIHSVLILLQK